MPVRTSSSKNNNGLRKKKPLPVISFKQKLSNTFLNSSHKEDQSLLTRSEEIVEFSDQQSEECGQDLTQQDF